MNHPESLDERPSDHKVGESEQLLDASTHDPAMELVDLASLQRELAELRSKVTALEREADLDILEEDKDDELPEFVRPGDTDEGFHVQWEDWMARRKVAWAIIRKVDRLKKQRKENLGRGVDHNGHIGTAKPDKAISIPPLPPTCDPSTLEPMLNLIPWSKFRRQKDTVSRRAVIDVLLGASDPGWSRGGRAAVGKSKADDGNSVQSDVSPLTLMSSGTTALPERICINSPLLLSILRDVHPGWGPEYNESIVLLRPFKILLYHQETLQSIYTALMDKYERDTTLSNSTQSFKASMSQQRDTDPENVASDAGLDATRSSPFTEDGAALNSISEKGNSKLALQHMHVLMQFVNNIVMVRQRYIESERCQDVTFSDLWMLFKPGDFVFASNGTQAYRIYEIQTPVHKAKSPWDFKSFLDPAFDPPLPGGAGAAGPYRSGTHIGDDLPFRLWCVYIDSDGFGIGPVTIAIDIPPFVGEKPVADLPLVPLRFRPPMLEKALSKYGYTSNSSWSELRKSLVSRGREFVEMNTIRHAHYKGPAHNTRSRLEGQVVVDITHAYEANRTDTLSPPQPPPAFYYWARGTVVRPTPDQRQMACQAGCCFDHVVWADQAFDECRNTDFRDTLVPMDANHPPSIAAAERIIAEVTSAHEAGLIADDEYLIMSERVLGFILQSRKWVELNLGYLSSVKYDKTETVASTSINTKAERTAFDELVLPDGHRDVILSLVAQHFRDEESHEVDIFKGKGKGLILLLHGAPGVGKTSTAEGVAEAFKKPLLQITCGDLGSTAREVEEALARNFELASRWDCVLLLDEADVFLASRSRADSGSDLNRNALVAVFLRVLEYYTGILFLTTNRIGDFDEAFASRVHVSLEYPQLTKDSTTSILKLNIRMIRKRFDESKRKIEIDEVDISASFLTYWLVNTKARLNGRQIRNACQTALALAEFEAQGGSHEAVLDPDAIVHLKASHFDTILNAYLGFNKYLKDIYGVTQDERATEKGYRAPQGAPPDAAGTTAPQFGAPQPSGFPGMHLYQQKPQMVPAHQMATPSQHVFHPQPQAQQGYYMPTQQQGYAIPPQNANNTLQYYPQPLARNEGQSVSTEHGINQGGSDTSAGHDPHAQMGPYPSAPGAQYLQPPAIGPRH